MTQHSIHSFTDPNRTYIVREMPDGSYRCSCPSFIFNERKQQYCKHIEKFLSEQLKIPAFDSRLGFKIIPNDEIQKGFKKKNETHILVNTKDYELLVQTPTSKLYMALLKLENIYE